MDGPMIRCVADRVGIVPRHQRARFGRTRSLAVVALALTIASCGPRTMRLQPVSGGALPVTFAYGSLRPEMATFREATDPRTGYSVKRMIVPGHDEFAIVDVISLVPPYVFEHDSAHSHATQMLNDRRDLSWGEAGTVRTGAETVAWQKFQKRQPAASCLAMTRRLRESQDSRTYPATREVATAIYCRPGSTPLPSAEVPAIASALRPRS